jgi:ABC-2 type transport system ATP-binding protein
MERNVKRAGGSTAVTVRDLTKTFGGFTAVNKVSFDVSRGEIFGFLGPNGAGKSTTIRMLCGILKPTSGKAQILGYSAFTEQENIRQSIGYMSQKFSLFDDLTVQENLDFFGTLYGIRGKELSRRTKDTILEAGLKGREKDLTGSLPAGIKQRLALGTATIHEPEILFLDEPTSGVDPSTRENFWRLIYAFASQGKTVFITTHYMDEAEHCGRMALIIAGKMIALGSPAELKKSLPYDIFAVSTRDYLGLFRKLEGIEFLRDKALFGRDIHLLVDAGKDRRSSIEKILRRHTDDFTVRKAAATLEDVFVHFAGKHQ